MLMPGDFVAHIAQPSDEHFAPLLFALGAAGLKPTSARWRSGGLSTARQADVVCSLVNDDARGLSR